MVGVVVGIWRIVITALFNIVHLGRLDISLLNRSVEAFDPGTAGFRARVHSFTAKLPAKDLYNLI